MAVLIARYCGTVEGFKKYLTDVLLPAAESEQTLGPISAHIIDTIAH